MRCTPAFGSLSSVVCVLFLLSYSGVGVRVKLIRINRICKVFPPCFAVFPNKSEEVYALTWRCLSDVRLPFYAVIIGFDVKSVFCPYLRRVEGNVLSPTFHASFERLELCEPTIETATRSRCSIVVATVAVLP